MSRSDIGCFRYKGFGRQLKRRVPKCSMFTRDASQRTTSMSWPFIPSLGAIFGCRRPSAWPKTAILNYGLWRNAFGANPEILGQTVLLKGEPHTVIACSLRERLLPLTLTCIQRFSQPPGRRNGNQL